jgi:DNA-binding Lrp family transcriptional regulator
MAVVAFVLIQTDTGRAFAVAGTMRAVDGVIATDVVTGPYDVIVKIRAGTLDNLAKLVVSKIQAIDGITRTYTCPVFKEISEDH